MLGKFVELCKKDPVIDSPIIINIQLEFVLVMT